MPITQDRMLAVIGEAQKTAEVLAQLKQDALMALDNAALPVMAKLIVLREILQREAPLMLAVYTENEHFKRAGRANEKRKVRMQRARTRKGTDHDQQGN